MDIKICDFGLARMIFHVDDIEEEPNLSTEVVTKCYRPPELFFENSNYTSKIDIWSLGCVIMELFTKEILFNMEKIE